jgi:hypothetical protein
LVATFRVAVNRSEPASFSKVCKAVNNVTVG